MFPTPTLFTAASRAARASKLDSTSLCWRDQGRADEPENPLRWRAAGQPRRRRRGRDALGRRRGRADGGGGGICAAPARGRRCGAQKRPHRLLGRCADPRFSHARAPPSGPVRASCRHCQTERDCQHAASNAHRRALHARAPPALRRVSEAGLAAARVVAAAEHGCCCLRCAGLLPARGAPVSGSAGSRATAPVRGAPCAGVRAQRRAHAPGGRRLVARAQATRARRSSTSRRPSVRSAARRARPTPTVTPPPPPGRPSWSAAARTSRSRRRAPAGCRVAPGRQPTTVPCAPGP